MMRRKTCFLSSIVLFVLLVSQFVVQAEVSSTMWIQTYGGDGYDRAEAVIQTSDGGYAIAGRTGSFGSGGYEFWLIKTDSLGNIEWNKTYGSGSAYSVVQTSDGGYAIAGSMLVKTDSEGSIQWSQPYEYGSPRCVVQTSDGGYALAGTQMVIADDAPTGSYAWIIKTDSEGNIPEFPSWTIVPLVVATTLIAIYFKKKTVNKSTV
jgi:hypothetical protein